jgi:rhodanese-related sulfurtransferase
MFYKMLSIILVAAPLAATPQPPSTAVQQMHTTIKVDELKSWYDQKKPMVIIDSRSEKYFDGRLLPNAKWLPSESTEKEILATILSKDSLIVVYCAGIKCPASGWLYDKLYSMGYHNLYEYHEGIEEWTQKGYPITKQQ